MLAISLTARDSSVSLARFSSGTQRRSILSCSAGMIEIRLALPQRSPQPLIVPCTCMQPASTPASAFATARSLSLCVWIPSRVGTAFFTAATTSRIVLGRLPPLVSHMQIQSAPASAAALIAASA